MSADVRPARIAAPTRAASWTRLTGLARALWLRLGRAETWQFSVALFALGVVVRMLLVFLRSSYLKTSRFEMERIALSMATHGTLADPYRIPTGPSAHVAPGYALILAAIYWLFGSGAAGEVVKQFCSAAVSSAQYALLPLICPHFGMARRVGLAASLFGAMFPLKFSTEVLGDWEAPYAAVALLLLAWCTAVGWKEGHLGFRRGLLHGVGWGLALLITPSVFPVLAIWLALGFLLFARPNLGPYLAYSAALSASVVLCLAPWAIRNERQLGAPIFTRSDFGLELYVSNNDLAGPLEVENYRRGVYYSFHPLLNLREARDVRTMGEAAYNRDRLHRALEWIRRHSGRFAHLTAERALYTWFPKTMIRWRDALSAGFTLAGIAGLLALWRRERKSALLLGGAILAYTPVYYLVQVNVRYRYPIDWIFLLAASHLAVSAAAWVNLNIPGRTVAMHPATVRT